MLRTSNIAAIAALSLLVSGTSLAESLPSGFKYERQEMPKVSGPYDIWSWRWITLPNGTIEYRHKSKSVDDVSEYVEYRTYYKPEGVTDKDYLAFFRVCDQVFPEFPYYVAVEELHEDSDLQVFVDRGFSDGISEIVGTIKRNPQGASPVYDYHEKFWDSFIPPCNPLIS